MKENAYWLFPCINTTTTDSGVCVGVKVDSRHILMIVKNPEQFGETENSCKVKFEEYMEQVFCNVEGRARNDIVKRVIERGFTRIRTNGTKKSQHWSIQTHMLTPAVNDLLWQWSNYILKQTGRDRYADVVLHEIGKNNKIHSSINIIASGHFIEESTKKNNTSSIRMYDEHEAHILPRWLDYAHTIDQESLSEGTRQEIVDHLNE